MLTMWACALCTKIQEGLRVHFPLQGFSHCPVTWPWGYSQISQKLIYNCASLSPLVKLDVRHGFRSKKGRQKVLFFKSQRLTFSKSMHFCFCVKCSYAKICYIHHIHHSYVCPFGVKSFLPPGDHSHDTVTR